MPSDCCSPKAFFVPNTEESFQQIHRSFNIVFTTMNKYFILIFTFCTACIVSAQTTFSFTGKITDSEGESLAFVAIIPNDDMSKGVISDIEGRFTVMTKMPIKTLTFRAIGLQTLTLLTDNLPKKGPLSITLKISPNQARLLLFHRNNI